MCRLLWVNFPLSCFLNPGIGFQLQKDKFLTNNPSPLQIKYANSYSIPFLAINGGHGTYSSLSTIKSGIGIYLRGLSGVSLSPSNPSHALILGGTLTGEVISGLQDLGKQAVAGACDCVGFTSPVLGGGHGWLQGRYGLMLDNLVSARVVLADGTAITVDEKHHPNLFWGLRGAGHNFGIVTSVIYKIYDRTPDIATAAFTFTQDRLEDVFAIVNQWLAAPKRPVQLTHFGIFLNNPAVDSKPLIILLVYWQGAGEEIPTKYTDPLNALKPINVVKQTYDLRTINTNTGSSYSGPACAPGAGRLSVPVDLDSWNLANLRTIIDLLDTFPAPLRNSTILLEGYATNRVHEIPASSTAYAHRSRQLLASPFFTYPPNDALVHETVLKLGRQITAAFLNGTALKLNAYVNYATGEESQEALFGYEPWRLRRLRGLKRKYDPFERFSFYGGIKLWFWFFWFFFEDSLKKKSKLEILYLSLFLSLTHCLYLSFSLTHTVSLSYFDIWNIPSSLQTHFSVSIYSVFCLLSDFKIKKPQKTQYPISKVHKFNLSNLIQITKDFQSVVPISLISEIWYDSRFIPSWDMGWDSQLSTKSNNQTLSLQMINFVSQSLILLAFQSSNNKKLTFGHFPVLKRKFLNWNWIGFMKGRMFSLTTYLY